MTNIVEEGLVRRAELAEAPLERARAHPQGLRNLPDRRPVSGDRPAESVAYVIGEGACGVISRERQIQPRHQDRKELGISMDHRESERGLVEDHQVVWRIEAELTAEVSPEDRLVRPTSRELEASRPYGHHGSVLGEVQDSSEDQVGQQRRWVLVREQPLEAQPGLATARRTPQSCPPAWRR